ncbi:PLDc N-terminal domain-containing protein [Sediminitomix flava]|uniref:Phospholipase D-like protein n=1 Tax=Sediminitomix flava TaxID=379075 RepID=A0A315Z6S7_SEDFL|nr:phospholipase D-like protein [Sediminitomix flava]
MADISIVTPGIGLIFWTLLLFFSLPITILWIYVIVDILRSNHFDSNTRLMWIIIAVFVPVMGSILYLIMGKDKSRSGM